jgi:hypothetical protein
MPSDIDKDSSHIPGSEQVLQVVCMVFTVYVATAAGIKMLCAIIV